MLWHRATGWRPSKAQVKAWAFLLVALAIFSVFRVPILEAGTRVGVTEDLSADEKKAMIEQLFLEGDGYFEQKNYNLANASYESIFLLEPNNLEASKRIDRLKNHMLKEGRSETELVTRVYDSEIEERAHQYLERAKQLMAEQKWGQARFTLQKLILISPLHPEANKLYEELNKKLQHESK